jgi:hypothetical protein
LIALGGAGWLRVGGSSTGAHVGACVERLDRGAHACAAGADDEHVVLGYVAQAVDVDGIRLVHSSR